MHNTVSGISYSSSIMKLNFLCQKELLSGYHHEQNMYYNEEHVT